MRRAEAICLLGLYLGAACSTMPFAVTFPSGPYGAVVKRNTRSQAIYHNMDIICFVFVTNETEEFKRARQQKLAEAYHISLGEAAQRAGDIDVRQHDEHEFFVALSTADRWANNMDRPTSQWGVALSTPTGLVHPHKIVRVTSKPVEIQSYFPYFDNFFVAYHVRFSADVGDGPYTLIVSSPRGEARLKFGPPPEQPVSSLGGGLPGDLRPAGVGIELRHTSGSSGGVSPEVLLVHDAIRPDDE